MPIPQAPARRIVLLTLGCKLNQADSDAIAAELYARGCSVADRPGPADAVIVNSCSVTHVADRKSRHLVRLARRLAPGAPIALTGCYVDTAGGDAARALGADLVLPNRDKPALVEALLGRAAANGDGRRGGTLRTRAFIRVQQGCNDVCAFCIVPRTRGREQSRPIPEVIGDVRSHEAQGALEVVLTGTQLGAYGRDRGPSLAEMLRTVLAETSVPRLRVSSLQPQDLSPELLSLWSDPRLCRHFHLALQSGSDAVLARMRRRYDAAGFAGALDLVRSFVPQAAITTDVIAGFPGETDAEFELTLEFCRSARFAGIHVFPYSPRSGTVAAKMPDQVAAPVKRERARRLLALAAASATRFASGLTGLTETVLWERCRDDGGLPLWEGLTDTYVRVFAPSARDLGNRLTPARVLATTDGGVRGEVPA